jgi:hypothetical protein
MAGYALSYSLAQLAAPYGVRQDAGLERKYLQNARGQQYYTKRMRVVMCGSAGIG